MPGEQGRLRHISVGDEPAREMCAHACQLSVRIAARVFRLSTDVIRWRACGGGGQTLASPTRAAGIAAGVLPPPPPRFVSQCGAEPPLSPIALPTSRLVDSAGFDATPHHLDRQDRRRCYCFRPSNRATTARRSFRGERIPRRPWATSLVPFVLRRPEGAVPAR